MPADALAFDPAATCIPAHVRSDSGDHQSEIAGKEDRAMVGAILRGAAELQFQNATGRRLASDTSDPKMFPAGLDARVSTKDHQTRAMRSRAMREYARRGWTIPLQVREVNSGAVQGGRSRELK